MQKLIQRSSAAKREAARRATRQVGARESEHVFQYRQQLKAQKASQAMYVKSERERRRETYEAGVLAPRYDVGESVENFATVDPYVVTGISKAWKHYKDLVIPFAEGDRVVITKGRDKGRIGRIATIDEKAGCVKINGLNMGDWFVPEHARIEDSDPRSIVPQPLPIAFENIKLVHALRNPETGSFQDTILDSVVVKGAGFDAKTREYRRGTRFVPGLGEKIPWPATEDPPEPETHDDDTYRVNVDEVTDRPYLLQPPMPPTVIDELRNKYSVHRDRHEDWYEAAKVAEDAARSHKKKLAAMVSTPLMELRELKKQEKLDKDAELTDEQLATIGRVIAQEKLNATRKVAQGEQ